MVIWRRPEIIRRRYFCNHRIYTYRDSDSEQVFCSPRLKWFIYEFERHLPQILTSRYFPSYPGLIRIFPRLTRSIPSTTLAGQNWANSSMGNSVNADSSDPAWSTIPWYSRSTDLEPGPYPIHSEMIFLRPINLILGGHSAGVDSTVLPCDAASSAILLDTPSVRFVPQIGQIPGFPFTFTTPHFRWPEVQYSPSFGKYSIVFLTCFFMIWDVRAGNDRRSSKYVTSRPKFCPECASENETVATFLSSGILIHISGSLDSPVSTALISGVFPWNTLQESCSLISNPAIHTMVSEYVKVLSTIHYQIAVIIPVAR